MNVKTLAKITFFRVLNNAAKINFITSKAKQAFQQEKRLLIAVPTFEAAQYLESLLWRIPEDSFMPHVIADTQTKEWIAITMQDTDNVNRAPRLLNLCSTIIPLCESVEEVYELYDESTAQKLELSKQRLLEYRSRGFPVKSEGVPLAKI